MVEHTQTIYTTPREEFTYNSSHIHSFVWFSPDSVDEVYEEGKLIVRYRRDGSEDHPHRPPKSMYTYDVRKEAYKDLKRRAMHPDQFSKTAGEWFERKFPYEYFTVVERAGKLYESKEKFE